MSWLDRVRQLLQGQLDAAGGTLDAVMPLLIPLLILTIGSRLLRFLEAEMSSTPEERADQIARAARMAARIPRDPPTTLEPEVAKRLERARARLLQGPPKS